MFFGEGTICISLMAPITSHSCCFSRLVTRNLQVSISKNEIKISKFQKNSRCIGGAPQSLHGQSLSLWGAGFSPNSGSVLWVGGGTAVGEHGHPTDGAGVTLSGE